MHFRRAETARAIAWKPALALAAFLTMLVAVIATPALAQDEGEDPRGGIFAQEPFEPLTERNSSQNANAQFSLFERAVGEFENGRLPAAQRLFERVIALDHKSPLAAEARFYLADLYRTDKGAAAARSRPPQVNSETSTTTPHPSLPWARPQNEDVTAPAARMTAHAPQRNTKPPRPSTARVSAALEQRFLREAGDRVFFGLGSADLGGRAYSVIRAQARWLGERPNLSVTIEGYADDPPLLPAQQAELSERRARAVRERLIAEGIEAHRLSIVSWGRERRVANCEEPSCAAQNRRAICVLIQSGKSREIRPIQPAGSRSSSPGKPNDPMW